ncbi:hypothetical protein GCM10027610_055580 [Dactylosporangium cerinum]
MTAGLPPGVDAVCFFLSRRASDADSARFLAAVVPQLAALCGTAQPAANRCEFAALWQAAAARAERLDRHLLLVVDGLDEDLQPPGLPSVAAVLPTLAGGRAHVLVSSRPHPQLPVDVASGHPLRVADPVAVRAFSGAAHLADLARQEIDLAVRGPVGDLAAELFGLLTVAAGALTPADLADLTGPPGGPTAVPVRARVAAGVRAGSPSPGRPGPPAAHRRLGRRLAPGGVADRHAPVPAGQLPGHAH